MKDSKIQWTDHTFNPWEGCTKVSPGCAHCYAEARNKRWAGGKNWGPGAPRRRTSPSNWKQVIKWDDEARLARIRARVFCASLADWLDAEVPIAWLVDLLDLIRSTPNLDWLLLTKRPELWSERIFSAEIEAGTSGRCDLANWIDRWRAGPHPENVWIGTTVEDTKRREERLPLLARIPAAKRFLSVEPMLEAIDLALPKYLGPVEKVNELYSRQVSIVSWVICGGESGPGARPFFAEWADDLRRQCKTAGVAFFMKQMGSNVRTENANTLDWPEHVTFSDDGRSGAAFAAARVGLNDRGHGGDIEEFPAELRIRELPR